jgi:hypothetical protein
MITGGLETIFISNPVDGEDNTIGSGERVRSLGDGTDVLGFRSDLFLAAAL